MERGKCDIFQQRISTIAAGVKPVSEQNQDAVFRFNQGKAKVESCLVAWAKSDSKYIQCVAGLSTENGVGKGEG